MAKLESDSVPCLNLKSLNQFSTEDYSKRCNQISPAISTKSGCSTASTASVKSTQITSPLQDIVNSTAREDDENSSLATDSEDEIDEGIENNKNPINYGPQIRDKNIQNDVLALTSAYHEKIDNLEHNTTRNNIAIADCENITIGNKIFYNGPVTIMLDKDIKNAPENGVINPAFCYTSEKYPDMNESQTTPNAFKDAAKNDRVNQKFLLPVSRRSVILTALTAIIALCGIIYIIKMSLDTRNAGDSNKLGDGDDSRKNIAINSTIGQDLISANKILRFISRDEWLAQPPANVLDLLELPVNRVVITHTATEPCDTQAACTFRTRIMQTFHMESRGWDDIAYNFLIGGDGCVYEGRGWDKQGAHTKGYNKGSIGIAYIGTFISNLPNDKQLLAGKLLMEEGVRLRKLTSNYRIYAHRQLIPSESPGAAFYEIIKTWPHWSSENPDN